MRFHFGFCLQPIAGIKQRGKVRVHGTEWTELAVEEARNQFAEKTVVAGEADLCEIHAACRERAREHFKLRAFSGAVDSLKNDKFAAWRHRIGGQFSIWTSAQQRAASGDWKKKGTNDRAVLRPSSDRTKIGAGKIPAG